MHAYILWIATTAYALHIAEEYTFDWRGWTASISKLQVDWTHFAIGNAVVMVFGVSCAAVGWSAPAYALSLPALMLINATFFHVLPFLVMSKGRFSPGLGTAVLLFYPLAIWAFFGARADGVLSLKTILVSFLLGAGLMATPIVMLKLRLHPYHHRLFFVAVLVCAIHPLSCLEAEDPNRPQVIIGVLEYYHPKSAEEPPNIVSDKNPTYKRQVRVLFKKVANRWEAFEHNVQNTKELSESIRLYPEYVNWFVAFDGKTLSQFKSFRPQDVTSYSDIGLHVPDQNANLPVIGRLSREFSGWESEPALRPLVLVSENHTSDPDHWKPVRSLDSRITRLCFSELRKIRPTVNVSTEEEHEIMKTYKDDVILINKSYASSKGEYVVALSIDPSFQHVNGMAKEEWPSDWFYVDKEKIAHALGSGMRLVDAGDYDNDGTSEVVFWESDYNKGGYILFYNHFSAKEEFSWNYH